MPSKQCWPRHLFEGPGQGGQFSLTTPSALSNGGFAAFLDAQPPLPVLGGAHRALIDVLGQRVAGISGILTG